MTLTALNRQLRTSLWLTTIVLVLLPSCSSDSDEASIRMLGPAALPDGYCEQVPLPNRCKLRPPTTAERWQMIEATDMISRYYSDCDAIYRASQMYVYADEPVMMVWDERVYNQEGNLIQGDWHPDTEAVHIWTGLFPNGGETARTIAHEAAHSIGYNEDQADYAEVRCVVQ